MNRLSPTFRAPLPLGLSACLALGIAAASSGAEEIQALYGAWTVRIDGGGEIYHGTLKFRESEDQPGAQDVLPVTGEYETAGRDGRVISVQKDGEFLVAQVQTKMSGMPAKATFSFELLGDLLVGDVDFAYGSSARSYEFIADRVDSGMSSGQKLVAPGVGEPEGGAQPTIETRSGSVSFQNGAEGYAGNIDTELWAIAPSKALNRQGTLTADANNGGGESQVLMRFDGIFGASSAQVPQASRIEQATLKIVVFDPGSTVYVHRVLAPWGASATWDNLIGGLTVDNIEASTVRDGFSFGEINMDRQVVEFDVTQTVQMWSDGQPNLGWVFINTGGNGWDFYSGDWIEPELRPLLEVQYATRD